LQYSGANSVPEMLTTAAAPYQLLTAGKPNSLLVVIIVNIPILQDNLWTEGALKKSVIFFGDAAIVVLGSSFIYRTVLDKF